MFLLLSLGILLFLIFSKVPPNLIPHLAMNPIIGNLFTILYYTYFAVVRGALNVFACVEYGGRSVLRSDPSLECWTGTHSTLTRYAVASLVIYGAGVPALFSMIFTKNALNIKQDQKRWLLKLDALGEERSRYSKLYQDYRPGYAFWRLVLILRKLLIVLLVVLATNNAMFQSSSCVLLLLISYLAQIKYTPFISGAAQERAKEDAVEDGEYDPKIILDSLINYNSMEVLMLYTCIFILLGGMVLGSAQFDKGSIIYGVLTFIIGLVMCGSISYFCFILGKEVRRTCQPVPNSISSNTIEHTNPIRQKRVELMRA
jgi:hypothetical protein